MPLSADGAGGAARGAGSRRSRAAADAFVRRGWWRVLAVLYAFALTSGTHWPRLQLGTDDFAAPDKLIHAGAFATLTVLLARTGWFATRTRLLVVALLWAAIDEVTQSLPGLGRQMSLEDLLASSIGVLITMAALWAFAPLGGPAARLAQARRRWSIERAVRRPTVFLLMAVAGVGVGVVGGALLVILTSRFPRPMPVESALLGFGIGTVLGATIVLEIARWLARRRGERRCFHCNSPAEAVTFNAEGHGQCETCGAPLHAGQWTESTGVRTPVMRRLLAGAAGAAFLLFVTGLSIYGMVLLARPEIPLLAVGLSWYDTRSDDMRLVIDLGWIVAILAVATRLLRRGLARHLDAQDRVCIACGHDLRGTQIAHGQGRCGECGAAFMTFDSGA